MIKTNSKYLLAVAVLAVVGLFSSMVHYHSEAMECLEHAGEEHFVEYEVYCPISTLVSDADFIESNEPEIYFSLETTLFYQNDETLKNYSHLKLGRSPPSLA